MFVPEIYFKTHQLHGLSFGWSGKKFHVPMTVSITLSGVRVGAEGFLEFTGTQVNMERKTLIFSQGTEQLRAVIETPGSKAILEGFP